MGDVTVSCIGSFASCKNLKFGDSVRARSITITCSGTNSCGGSRIHGYVSGLLSISCSGDRTCPDCGFYSADEQELHSHVQDHKDEPEAQEDFPFEDQEERTTVTAEPDLLQNVNTDALQVESEEYDPDEEYDQKAKEARILQQYTGYKPKAGEALGDIMDGAIDTPLEQFTVNETIYDRKLDGYHEDKIARELFVYHDIEYEDAIEKIRSIEVNYNDITAKTLFGKKFADCNEVEISEMKILSGEAKKRSKGEKND